MLERVARTIAVVSGMMGLLATIASGLTEIQLLAGLHFGWLLAASWIVLTLGVWPYRRKQPAGYNRRTRRRVRDFIPVAAVAVVAVGVGAGRWLQVQRPEPLPRSEPLVRADVANPVDAPKTSNDHTDLAEKSQSSGPVQVVMFELASSKTSYVLSTRDWTDPLPYFELPTRVEQVHDVFASDCSEKPNAALVIQAFKQLAITRGRPDLLKYVRDYDALVSLVSKRGKVFREIMPTGFQWNLMPEFHQTIVLEWMRRCVGIMTPVFSVTLQNTGSTSVVVTGVRYNLIDDLGEAGGGPESGVIELAGTYVHGLRPAHEVKGRHVRYATVRPEEDIIGLRSGSAVFIPPPQTRPLDPPLHIGAGQSVRFEIQLYPIDYDWVLAPNVMSLDILTSAGMVRIPEFVVDFSTAAG